MDVSIKNQLLTILFSLILGILFGLIYDIFKIVRMFIIGQISDRTKNIFLKIKLPLIKLKFNCEKLNVKEKIVYLIFDIMFFIVITPIMQIFIYAFSNGIVRWYIFLGAFIGSMIYYATISRINLIIYEYIFMLVKIILTYILHFIILPFKKISRIIKEKHNYKKERRKALNKEKRLKEIEENRKVLIIFGKNNHRL
jgi:hypothetical protein